MELAPMLWGFHLGACRTTSSRVEQDLFPQFVVVSLSRMSAGSVVARGLLACIFGKCRQEGQGPCQMIGMLGEK
jgi:hypothetical protein